MAQSIISSSSKALVEATLRNDLADMNSRLSLGADVDFMLDSLQLTPLLAAARQGYVSAMELLISHGADIEKKNTNGY